MEASCTEYGLSNFSSIRRSLQCSHETTFENFPAALQVSSRRMIEQSLRYQYNSTHLSVTLTGGVW